MGTKKIDKKKPDATCSYSKLKSGNWGVRSTTEIKQGDTVTVTMKSGETREETVERVVWSGDGVWIAALVGKDSNGRKPAASDDAADGDGDLEGSDSNY